MLDSHAQIVMFAGPQFIALYNDAYAPSIGNKHPHALGQPARDYWTELWADLAPLLQQVLTTGETVSARDRPFRIERHGYPETVYFDISYSPVRDRDGVIHAVLCIVSETTARIRAEQDLREGEQRLRMLFEQANTGIAVGAPDGRLIMVNDCFCEITGYTQDELRGRRFEELLHPLDRAASQVQRESLTHDCANFTMEERLLRKDGTPVWVAGSIGGVFDATGRLTQICTIVADITERRRAEAQERRLAAIIASSDDAILSTDLDMRITSWNSGAERLYGYSAPEALGRSVTMLVPFDRTDEEPSIIAQIRAGRRVEPHETVRLHKSGRQIEVSLTVSPIFDEHGRIVGASKIARDITMRKTAERLQQILIAEMKHRVKNILATVHAIARQTFLNSRSPDAEVFDARLYSLSRAQDLITRDHRDGAELSALITEVVSPYYPERFDISGPKMLLSARAALTFALGLHELATNAVKYGALAMPGGRVAVSWTLENGRFDLIWTETGAPSAAAPSRKGFGTILIEEVMTAEIAGEVVLEFHPGGLVCRVTAPLDATWFQAD